MGNKNETGIIIAKIGTDTLIRGGRIDSNYATDIAEQVWNVRVSGTSVALVSSGRGALGGQEGLTSAWRSVFAEHGLVTREILFREPTFDVHVEEVSHAITDGVIPVINGDASIHLGLRTRNNDFLAAGLAIDLRASVAFLTTVNGVLDHNRQVISHLPRRSDIVNLGQSQYGTGGMSEKVLAARTVAERGLDTVIANGRQEQVLVKFAAGKNLLGTRIAA